MINMTVRKVHPDKKDQLVAWLREVNGPRRQEALESLAAEGIEHEIAVLIETTEGPVVIYAMQTNDYAHAVAVTDDSPRSIDHEHRRIMCDAISAAVPVTPLLNLEPLRP